jgi:hypothetical protein
MRRRFGPKGPRNLTFFVVFLTVCFCTAGLRAERPGAPDLLPSDTLAFLRISNSRELVDRFNETAMGRMVQQEQVAPLVQQLYGTVNEAFAEAEEELGVSLTELLRIPQGEVVLALVSPRQGPPALVMLVDVGDSRPVVDKLIERGELEMANDGWTRSTETIAGQEMVVHRRQREGKEEIGYFFKDDTLLAASNLEVTEQLLRRWEGEPEPAEPADSGRGSAEDGSSDVLADNTRFTAIMNRCRGSKDERPQLTWFVDPIELARVSVRGNFTAQASLAFLPVVGLDGVQGAGGSLSLACEKFDMIAHFHLLLDTPRRGVVEMVALRPGDTTPEPWVPQDVASYMTLNWDMDLTYDTLKRMYDSFRGEGRLSRDVQRRISEQMGADFEKEVLPAMEGRVTVLTWFEPPASVTSRARLMGIKLNDAGQFQAVMDKIVAKFPDAFEKKLYGNVSYYALDRAVMRRQRRAQPTEEPPPGDGQDLARRRVQPCMGIVGDYLIIADRPSFLEKIAAAKAGGAPALAEDLEYKLIASKIRRQSGGIAPAMVTFNRPEMAMRMMYDLVTADETREQLSRRAAENDFMSGVERALRDNPLPPFAVLQQYLAPGGGMITDDETGIHYMGFALRRE